MSSSSVMVAPGLGTTRRAGFTELVMGIPKTAAGYALVKVDGVLNFGGDVPPPR